MSKVQKGKPANKGQKQGQTTKRKPTFKLYENKFKDQIVDFFPAESGDLMFNKTPVVKGAKAKKAPKEKKKSIFQDKDEDSFDQVEKKVKTNDNLFEDEDAFFSKFNQDFMNYFIQNKMSLKSQDKIQNLAYNEGTLLLGAIGDFGPAGKYLQVNLQRNKKAYVSIDEYSDQVLSARNFKLGQYVMGILQAPRKAGKLQMSLKVSDINKDLIVEDLVENQVVCAEVAQIEDYGVSLTFRTDSPLRGFIKQETSDASLFVGQQVLVRVVKTEKKKKLILCDQNLLEPTKLNDNDLEGIQAQQVVLPGSLVSVQVLKKLENGLIVKFHKAFIGYIFDDHVDETMVKNAKFLARIIALDFGEKRIFLSPSPSCVALSPFEGRQLLGKVLEGPSEVKKELYGGSFLISVGGQTGFLHKSHLEGEVSKVKTVKVKEVNYFEQYPVFTAMSTDISKVATFNDIRVGTVYQGTITSFLKTPLQMVVQLAEGVSGTVDSSNFSDASQVRMIPKNLKLKSKISVRVLAKDEQSKRIHLTVKPQLMECEALVEKSDALVGKAYKGYVQNDASSGYYVHFFNKIHSHLQTESVYKVGQTIEVYVSFLSKKGNLGVSLTPVKSQVAIEAPNKDIKVALNDVIEVRAVSQESGYVLAKKGPLKVIIRDNQDSDFRWGDKLMALRIKDQKPFKVKVIEITESGNVFATGKKTLIEQEKQEPKEGQEAFYFVDKATYNGLVIRQDSERSYFISKKVIELSKEFESGQTITATIKKINEDKVLQQVQTLVGCKQFSANTHEVLTNYYMQEEQYVTKSFQSGNLKNYQIGQVLSGKINLIKEYGVIVSIDSLTGFILNQNLSLSKKDYKQNQEIRCQILDIDYEKEIIDLVQYEQTPVSPHFTILLVKENYLIGRINDSLGLYVYGTNENQTSYQIGNRLQNITVLKMSLSYKKVAKVQFFKPEEVKKQNGAPGNFVSGTVIKISKNFVFVQLTHGVGRCHKAQFDLVSGESNFDSIELQQSISCKILAYGKPTLELTCLKEHLALPNGRLESSRLIQEHKDNNGLYYGVIKSIQQQSIQPLYIELSGNQVGSISAFGNIFSAQDSHRLNQLEKEFSVGDVVVVKILSQQPQTPQGHQNFELKLASSPNYTPGVGSLVTAKVLSVHKTTIRAQVAAKEFVSIHITDIADEFVKKPLNHHPVQTFVCGRQLEENRCSLRESMVDQTSYDLLQGPTLAFKKAFATQEKQMDFRMRLQKFGTAGLSAGQALLAYVININPSGIFVALGGGLSARANTNQLSDGKHDFQLYDLVLCKVLEVKSDGKIDVSLKKSLVVYNVSEVKVGDLLSGIAKEQRGEGWMLALCGYNGKGELKKGEMKEGQKAVVQVKKVKEGRVHVELASGKPVQPDAHLLQIWESLSELRQNKEESMEEENEEEENEEEENEEEEVDEELMDIELNEEDSEDEGLDLEALQQEMEEESMEEEDDDEDMEEEVDDEEIDSSVDEEEPKKTSSKKRAHSKLEKELEIRKEENRLMDEERQPETEDDFEKQILKRPNDSYTWINYLAFQLEKEGVKGARAIIERALRVINFRNEAERVNLWTAYLNLEYNFGTQDSLILVFEKAVQANNPKTIYFKLIEMYARDKKWDVLEQILQKMIKKFKHSSKCWMEYIKNMMLIQGENSSIDMKTVLNRALQSVKKRKHIEILSAYARLEFQAGNCEKGRTTFEAILNNYPKRTDIWSVYLDQEIKQKQTKQIRNLFERCITLKLKPKKIQFFFKRYLEFEINQGDEKRVQQVKEKAQTYVQSIIGDQSEEEEEQSN